MNNENGFNVLNEYALISAQFKGQLGGEEIEVSLKSILARFWLLLNL